ncbi:hypothetical protein EF53_063 [Enterococcus phage 53]|uniref:Uncharacterized protein n=1 Tax=Enterococcus phage vB_Efs6_KEN16 TaxID=3138325 RepID=A0AAX4PTZ9_9CAUD|nr:hypothetical protein EF53_063 [Enterococcus phage 53]
MLYDTSILCIMLFVNIERAKKRALFALFIISVY